jgi:hypothetical protein
MIGVLVDREEIRQNCLPVKLPQLETAWLKKIKYCGFGAIA